MSNLLFLVVPAVIAALAVTAVWLRNRPETSPTSGIDRFSGQMAALAPGEDGAESPAAEVGIRVRPVDGGPPGDPGGPAGPGPGPGPNGGSAPWDES